MACCGASPCAPQKHAIATRYRRLRARRSRQGGAERREQTTQARDLSASVNTFFPAAHAKRAAVVFQTADPGGPLAEALAAFVDDAPAFARRVHATRYAPLEAFYEALRDSDAAPAPAGGVAGPTDGARFYRNAADAKRPRAAPQKDFYRNQAARALDKLRAAGVADVVLAHLLELWGLRRCGDAARLGPLLLGDE